MNNKTEFDIEEVVSGYYFVEINEDNNQGMIKTVWKAVKTIFINNT